MQTTIELKKKLERAFEPHQADVLSEVITEAYSELVKTGERIFNSSRTKGPYVLS